MYLPKEIEDIYIENYKTLMKEIKEDKKIWRNIPCSRIGRINILKMSILHYFSNKGPCVQGYGFISGHVWDVRVGL